MQASVAVAQVIGGGQVAPALPVGPLVQLDPPPLEAKQTDAPGAKQQVATYPFAPSVQVVMVAPG